MERMIFSKFKSAVGSSIILAVLYLLMELWIGFTGYVLFVLIYAFIGNVIYGIPVSILSDFATKKMKKSRFIFACLIHLLFGLLSSVFLQDLGIYAVSCSFLFFLLEEWQRRRKYNRSFQMNSRVMLTNTLAAVTFFALAICAPIYVWDPLLLKKTHEYYLIPKGYEGQVRVVYNVEHAPKPEKNGDYDVYRINENGYTLSPLPEGGGAIENQYFYIDEDGQKKKIDDSCIYHGGSEGIQTDGYEYTSSYFTITNTTCSQTYVENGDPVLPTGLPLEEIIQMEGLDKK
ncbi:DUF6843 domain-containing protein [Peribacillus glennii]|uniref:DUF6843 domain-containing protein n=1 Tax=Peribacillus glennii TaxID=2303991 RepID=A0A372L6S4_9BACI|nr:hypothetical protein [Peribacillus glennii]RFU60776.1 hypothetical protein D0466_20720 [Peribacillus glennii]